MRPLALRARRRPSRQDRPAAPRRHSALRLRTWITAEKHALDDAALHQELTLRRDLIDRAISQTLSRLGEDLTPATESPRETTPATPALYAIPADSLATSKARRQAVGSAIVADYWARRSYRGRPLPPIVWSVSPWALSSLGRIHVLDLPRSLLHQALARSPWTAELRRGGRTVRRFAALTLRELEQEAIIAAAFVALDPLTSCRSPYLTGLRMELLQRGHDGDADADDRDRARRALIELDRAAQPDLSCVRGCTAVSLRRLLACYRALRKDRGLSMHRAHERLAPEWRRTPKRIEALLADARRAECIAEVWADYCEWLASARPHAL